MSNNISREAIIKAIIKVIVYGVPALFIVLGFFAYVGAYTLEIVNKDVGMKSFGFVLILIGIIIYLTELGIAIQESPTRTLGQGMTENESKSKWKGAIYVIEVGAVLSLVGVFLLVWSLQTNSYEHPVVANITLISVLSLMFGVPILAVGIIAYFVTRKNQK